MSNKYLDEQGLQTVLTLLDDRYIHKNGNIINIKYSDLVSLRDNYKLIKGCKYRIIDYVTKTGQSGTTSAEHPFDIIVEALDTNILSEHAIACESKRVVNNSSIFSGVGLGSLTKFSNNNEIPEGIKNISSHNGTDYVGNIKYGMFSSKTLKKGELNASFKLSETYSNGIYCLGVDIIKNGVVVNYDYHRSVLFKKDDTSNYILEVPENGTYMIRFIIDVQNTPATSKCNATAELKEYNSYFDNNQLEAWKLKYSLDNNTSRFGWANSNNGKGVIYYMKDEYNNEAAFDFKNIKYDEFYTFDYNINGTHYDGSVKYGNKCFNNILCNDITAEESTNIPGLPKIIFKNVSESSKCCFNTFTTNAWTVIFGDSCSENKFLGKAENLTFGNDCNNNTFGKNCKDNTLNEGCQNNIFGDNCTGNRLYSNCQNNKFELSCGSNCLYNDCQNNIFGNNCTDNQLNAGCTYNIFGDNCTDNVFGNLSIGAYCTNNTFGDNCSGNQLGPFCQNNKFELSCGSNCLYDNCLNNTFGNNCNKNSLTKQCKSNTLGNKCSNNIIGANSTGEFIDDANSKGCNYNTFGEECENNILHYDSNYNTFGKTCKNNILEYGNRSNKFNDSCTANKLGISSGWNTFKDYCENNIAGENFQSNSFGVNCSNNNFGKNNLRLNIGNKVQNFKICKAAGNVPNEAQILSYVQQIEVGDNCNNLTLYTADLTAGLSLGSVPYYIQNYKIGNNISGTIDLENNCTNKSYITNIEKNVNNEIKKHCLINGAVATVGGGLTFNNNNLNLNLNNSALLNTAINVTDATQSTETNYNITSLRLDKNGKLAVCIPKQTVGGGLTFNNNNLNLSLSTNVNLGTTLNDVIQEDEDKYDVTSVRLDKNGKLAVCIPKQNTSTDVNLTVGSGLIFNNNELYLSLTNGIQLGSAATDVGQSEEANYDVTSVRLDKNNKLAVCIPKQNTSTTSSNSFIAVDTSMMDKPTVDLTIGSTNKLKYNTVLALSTGVTELKLGSNSFAEDDSSNPGKQILSYGITIDVENKTKFTYPNNPNELKILWANNEAPCASGGNLDKGLWEFIFTYTPVLKKYSGTFAKYN